MNKLIALSMLLIAGCTEAKDISQPKDTTKYVEQDRFITISTTGFIDKIITDTKTGCQYMALGGEGWSITPLGCFEEYKTKGAK